MGIVFSCCFFSLVFFLLISFLFSVVIVFRRLASCVCVGRCMRAWVRYHFICLGATFDTVALVSIGTMTFFLWMDGYD